MSEGMEPQVATEGSRVSAAPFDVWAAARKLAASSLDHQADPSKGLREGITRATDDLLRALLQGYAPPDRDDPSLMSAMRQVFAKRESCLFDGGEPCDLPDAMIPAAIMRELCFRFHLPFLPRACRHWEPFVDRYVAYMQAPFA